MIQRTRMSLSGKRAVRRSLWSNQQGFTLVEVLAAWTILLIGLLITLKVFVFCHESVKRGQTLRSFIQEEKLAAEEGLTGVNVREERLNFEMDGKQGYLDVIILEYISDGWENSHNRETFPYTIILPAK